VLNVYGISDGRHTEMHKTELLVPKPSSSEVEIAVEKLKRYKSASISQILTDLIQAGCNALHSEIHKYLK
jgi:hypothetical protein